MFYPKSLRLGYFKRNVLERNGASFCSMCSSPTTYTPHTHALSCWSTLFKHTAHDCYVHFFKKIQCSLTSNKDIVYWGGGGRCFRVWKLLRFLIQNFCKEYIFRTGPLHVHLKLQRHIFSGFFLFGAFHALKIKNSVLLLILQLMQH